MSKDVRDDFDGWCNQWEKALKDGIFDDAPKPPQPAPPGPDFFGQYSGATGGDVNDAEAKYWADVYKMSGGNMPDEQLNEMKLASWEKRIPASDTSDVRKDKAKTVADDPNPIYPDSYGRDGVSDKTGMTRVSAGWGADDRLSEIEDMKKELYDLECTMGDKEGFTEEKAKAAEGKINALKKKLDDLSNSLHGAWGSGHNYG
jgi:hypothetical protein